MSYSIIALMTILTSLSIPSMSPLEDAVWSVESARSTDPNITGDNGKAIGPLQIWKIAWTDVCLPGEKYEDCRELAYSLEVFRRYTARYAKASRLGHEPTDIDRARIWNGGPNGFKKSSTLPYAKKIRKALEQ